MPVAASSILRARECLKLHLPLTRLLSAPALSRRIRGNAYLKMETDLPTGSFKPRGAIYALSLNLARRPITEVVACSTGNHGAAVAYAAKQMGVAATIFLPIHPNPVKRAKIIELGAQVVERGTDLAEAFELASKRAQENKGVYFLNDATDPDLPAGTATIACEILEQLPAVQQIYVPVGDTALIRGVASGIRQFSSTAVKIVGVQAENAQAYFISWKSGRAISTETCDTIADGLATRTPDEANVRDIREMIDDMLLVSEGEMLAAMQFLLFEEHVVAEPSGAAATAALLQSAGGGANSVALVTGANVSPGTLRQAANVGG